MVFKVTLHITLLYLAAEHLLNESLNPKSVSLFFQEIFIHINLVNACLVKVGLSLQSDMSRAQLVISHAGAGTCLEVRHCQDQFRVCQGQFRVLHGHPGLRVIFVPVWVSSAGSVRSCVCRKISKIMPDMLTTLLLVLKKGLVLNISSG